MRPGCLLAVATCALVLLVGSVTLVGCDPDRVRAIVGIALGEHTANVRIPRRALTCTETGPSRSAESCTVIVDGDELTVDVAYRNDRNMGFAACSATYRGTTAACWEVWYALTGGPPRYAAVPVVAPREPHETTQWLGMGRVERYRAPHLEVSEETATAIRQQYPFDNYFERDWITLIKTVAMLAGLAVAALTFALPRAPALSGRIGDGSRPSGIEDLWSALAWGAVVLVVTFIGLFFQAMRAGLID